MVCCEKKGIGSVFLQRGVFLVQRFLALEVGLDASMACADLLVGVHMRHLVHVVLLDGLEQVRADEGGVHALDGDVAVEQAAVIPVAVGGVERVARDAVVGRSSPRSTGRWCTVRARRTPRRMRKGCRPCASSRATCSGWCGASPPVTRRALRARRRKRAHSPISSADFRQYDKRPAAAGNACGGWSRIWGSVLSRAFSPGACRSCAPRSGTARSCAG